MRVRAAPLAPASDRSAGVTRESSRRASERHRPGRRGCTLSPRGHSGRSLRDRSKQPLPSLWPNGRPVAGMALCALSGIRATRPGQRLDPGGVVDRRHFCDRRPEPRPQPRGPARIWRTRPTRAPKLLGQAGAQPLSQQRPLGTAAVTPGSRCPKSPAAVPLTRERRLVLRGGRNGCAHRPTWGRWAASARKRGRSEPSRASGWTERPWQSPWHSRAPIQAVLSSLARTR